MKKFNFAAVVTCAVLCTPTSFAQGVSSGAYFGLEGGAGSLKDSTGEVAGTLVNAVGGSAVVTQDASVLVGRLLAGYQFNENVSAELGYSFTGSVDTKITGVSSSAVAYTGTAKATYSGVDYSVLIRPSVSSGANGFFLKLGGHNLTVKTEATLTGTSTASASSSISGTGTLFGFGYDWPFSTTSFARLSYTAYNKIAGGDGNQGVVSFGLTSKF
jgi:hypothetical protein